MKKKKIFIKMKRGKRRTGYGKKTFILGVD